MKCNLQTFTVTMKRRCRRILLHWCPGPHDSSSFGQANLKYNTQNVQINLSWWKNCFKWLTCAGQEVFGASLFPVPNFCFLYMHFGLFTLWEEEAWPGTVSARSWLQELCVPPNDLLPYWAALVCSDGLMSRAACARVPLKCKFCAV